MTTATALPYPDPSDCLGCYLEHALARRRCDGTCTLTTIWLATTDLEPESVVRVLESRGGFCDCEVLGTALEDPLVMGGVELQCAS